MRIDVISIGKLPVFQRKLADNYCKMIKWKLKETEITYSRKLSEAQIKPYEARLIGEHLNNGNYKIILDLKGQEITSEGLSKLFKSQMMSGQNVSIVIGGAFGLDDSVIRMADFVLKLSDMTFPHSLARLIMLEQIYRAQAILEAHPYHK